MWLAGLAGLALGAGTAGIEHELGRRAVVSEARAESGPVEPAATAPQVASLESAAAARAQQAEKAEKAPPEPRPDPWNPALAKALEGAPEAIVTSWTADPAPTFVGEDGLADAGGALLAAMEAARHRGLRDPSARAAELRAAAGELPAGGDDEASLRSRAEARARLEVALAVEAAALVADLRPRPIKPVVLADERGRYLPPDVLTKDPAPPLSAEELDAMRAAARAGGEALTAWLDAQLPQTVQYRRLVEASGRYEELCAGGKLVPIPTASAWRKSGGDEAGRMRLLQQRLAAEGYLTGEPSGRLDDATRDALRHYQANQQLRETGRLDDETIESMAVPCEERLRTLRLNAQRWRTTARRGEATYVEVNLASQRVRFVVDGALRMGQRAVVGTGRWFWNADEERRIYPKASPILHDEINQVIVNPSWTVPGSIVRLEFQKKIDKDPQWLEKKGYVVVKAANGYETIVQPPGPKNTLGEVKMIFPNSESVYLHDTNQRGFFRRARRDLSHGCIRVQNALDFASELLAWDAERRGERWPDRRLHVLARSDTTYWYKIEKPIPIFIEYYTATVDDDGIASFHWDIYDYDRMYFEGPLGRR
ncbi:MAG: L,D-transpeptidase family protein [Deltaproteobacteria bacterium]|nr:L,D-transpeptidase family protein [Deltaproteobacteria bacterium]